MGNVCSCLPEEEELEVDDEHHHQQITTQPQTTTPTLRLSVRSSHEVASHTRRQREELRTIEEAIRNRFAAPDRALPSQHQPKDVRNQIQIQNRRSNQTIALPQTARSTPRAPARDTNETAVHNRRKKEDLRSTEEALANRFAASVKTKHEPKNDGREIQIRNAKELISVHSPSSGKVCEKILSEKPEFGQYMDAVYFADCNRREYIMVDSLFRRTTQRHYEIVNIEKIFNPHLQANYMLRKHEYCLLYGKENVKEELLFHGTKFSNVDNISSYNLDWRRKGAYKGHIFGQGVSFTPISNYASHYSDDEEVNVMFVFTVLVCHFCEGTKNMIMPPLCDSAVYHHARFDTSGKPNRQVLVKFRDDEFYPSYLIKYKGRPIKKVV